MVQQGHSIAVQQASAGETLSDEDIRAELARILSSDHFHAGTRRRAFLRYVVEETLAGRAARLKGYNIALAVFDRDETFDSQADPVVRLEARRLRRDLDSFYVDAGSHDAVRISIPKGSYVPKFERHETTAPGPTSNPEISKSPEPPPRPTGKAATAGRFIAVPNAFYGKGWMLSALALVLVAIGVVVGGWALSERNRPAIASDDSSGPAVAVMPFQAYGSTETSRFLADGISEELVASLMRFPGFRLYAFPARSAAGSQDQGSLGTDLGVSYVVHGSVREEAQEVRVSAQLLNADTGRVLWTATYDRPLTPNALIAAQRDLAGEIATALGQPYGIVNKDIEARTAMPDVSNMESYLCVLRAYDYRRGFSREAFGPVLGCLEEAVRRDPEYGDAWAMLGWLHLDAGRFEFAGDLEDQYEKAFVAASRAVELEPDNTLALKALSAINHYMGRYDESERLARRTAELNPYDPDTLAQLGWRLAVRGNFEEGIPILRQATARTVNPPGWYFHLIAIDLYLNGEFQDMLEVSQRSAVDGSGFSQMLIAIANTALGNLPATQEALAQIGQSGLVGRDPVGFLVRHGATDEIVDALITGLQKAKEFASEA